MKSPMKKILAVAVGALGLAAGAANVEITSVTQTPGSGQATVNYTVSGLSTRTDLTIKACANGKSITNTVAGVANGTGSQVVDYKSALGAAPNVAFSAVLTDPDTEGVQLWAEGPYWATCNVGASKPEDCGYYFWWGDTVGYTFVTNRFEEKMQWEAVSSTATIEFRDDSAPAGKTCDLTVDQLKAGGYLDSNGNLASSHDAATAHLGAPWRMPTAAEHDELVSKCTWVWTNNWNGTGVNGYLFKGNTTGYTDKSIFLPAAGYGDDSGLGLLGSYGDYWSSTPTSDSSFKAWHLDFNSGGFGRLGDYRSDGRSVRPVRGFAK